MIIEQTIVKVEIATTSLVNGTPFPVEQAHSFEHKDWEANFYASFPFIKILMETKGETNPPSSEWIDLLTMIHSTYRVQNFLELLKEKVPLSPVDIRKNYKGIQGFVLVDGRHRCWAHILNGDTHVKAHHVRWIKK